MRMILAGFALFIAVDARAQDVPAFNTDAFCRDIVAQTGRSGGDKSSTELVMAVCGAQEASFARQVSARWQYVSEFSRARCIRFATPSNVTSGSYQLLAECAEREIAASGIAKFYFWGPSGKVGFVTMAECLAARAVAGGGVCINGN